MLRRSDVAVEYRNASLLQYFITPSLPLYYGLGVVVTGLHTRPDTGTSPLVPK